MGNAMADNPSLGFMHHRPTSHVTDHSWHRRRAIGLSRFDWNIVGPLRGIRASPGPRFL